MDELEVIIEGMDTVDFTKRVIRTAAATLAGKELTERNRQVSGLRREIADQKTQISVLKGQGVDCREERDKNHGLMTRYWTDWKASEDRVELLERLLVENGVEVPEAVEAR